MIEVDDLDSLPWLVSWYDHGNRVETWCYAKQLKAARAEAPPRRKRAPSEGPVARKQRERTLPEDSAARKQHPLFTGPVLYFPAALAAVAKLCKDGNDKHNPGEPMHHARGKSTDHEDTILRHMLDAREPADGLVLGGAAAARYGRDEHGTPHVVMVAWRALALCQEWLEKHDGAPLAPGAKVEQ